VTLTVQLALGANVAVQVFVWANSLLSVPVTLTPLTERFAALSLVIVTNCASLVVLTD